MPGQTRLWKRSISSSCELQWRAGQLPGQTESGRVRACSPRSFNGGPGNCPAKPRRSTPPTTLLRCFNGGPGNCPAKRVGERRSVRLQPVGLQWRAGQLPGQTPRTHRRHRHRRSCFNGGPGNCPAKLPAAGSGDGCHHRASMEGRAIARPNAAGAPTGRHVVAASMEGRAIARPNRPSPPVVVPCNRASMEGRAIARPNQRRSPPWISTGRQLQWRAGQLPGQTVVSVAGRVPTNPLQWRAGQLPGQTPHD